MQEKDSSLIPVRMLTQYAYCHRLAYMEWVQGEFAYNADVVDGKYKHRNVDAPSGMKKMQEDSEDQRIHARSVMLSDSNLGMIAKIDLLEMDGKNATPIEYKRGTVPKNPENAYKDHMVQICAQGLLLRANGYKCTSGMIYYISSKQRIEIRFDDRIVAETLQMLYDMKEMGAGGIIPPPLVNSPKCPRCSLVGICLPDETNILSEPKHPDTNSIRRMYPIRNDSMPIYVQEQGARVSLSGDCINVKSADGLKKIRLIDISEVTVFGNVQITTQAIREMCRHNIPICYLSYGGWFVGMTLGASHKNIELRQQQHKKHADRNASVRIAREIVYGKIKNSITMLRRNHVNLSEETLGKIEELANRARSIKKYNTLLGIEGMAARLYFGQFNGMIKKADSDTFVFTDRNRRPPRDPINAMLSFLYSMLTRQAVTTVSMVGFDPYLGFLHMPKYGKPALALDIIEEFRPIVADSVCISLINNGMIDETDFVKTDFGTNLTSDGRRKVIKAYEQRMDSTIKHNILGYVASYRRIMETQTRLLARHVSGEIPSYLAFRTR